MLSKRGRHTLWNIIEVQFMSHIVHECSVYFCLCIRFSSNSVIFSATKALQVFVFCTNCTHSKAAAAFIVLPDWIVVLSNPYKFCMGVTRGVTLFKPEPLIACGRPRPSGINLMIACNNVNFTYDHWCCTYIRTSRVFKQESFQRESNNPSFEGKY